LTELQIYLGEQDDLDELMFVQGKLTFARNAILFIIKVEYADGLRIRRGMWLDHVKKADASNRTGDVHSS